MDISKYSDALVAHLANKVTLKEPASLYEPIDYILTLGGKRLRPVLTLMSADFFGGNYKQALDASLAVEMFHNFSLVHDDIMDNAPLRRGHQTVHEKWDVNTGILSGDAMLILAYQLFETYEPKVFMQLAVLFSKTALEVCEGQQYDVDFETRNDVTISQYIKMIEYKTAVLIGASLQMGAIIADASQSCQEKIYAFGKNLGIAFQLQDDYLDAFGNPLTFGKQVGGDIIANKKTFLYLTALQKSTPAEAQELSSLFATMPKDPSEKITAVKEIFVCSGAAKATEDEIARYTNTSISLLQDIKISQQHKDTLKSFADFLMNRNV
ncbi:polyprenyl synthetase family protein [Flavobacteriaceae bacterium]|nr:polyprenyl synthetase family protein [Flavobacteriaceae bacterium]MDB4115122.1 polyprenyl synthetase family protein [Flavobacteriaceae bacterium]MDB9858653.1 polyprenyl synthetase family protein [Flavobacteriaceae bacterium]MDC0097329.1 polyprenyl synthetase family protein [Flavobacteriaceae bacterium]MDC0342117.1 polyprenyl synthetase family protein [Flavobacteriaceae bacterium]